MIPAEPMGRQQDMDVIILFFIVAVATKEEKVLYITV